MSFMVFIGTGSVYILPFFFELVQNYNPAQIGLLLVVVPLLMGLVSPRSRASFRIHTGLGGWV